MLEATAFGRSAAGFVRMSYALGEDDARRSLRPHPALCRERFAGPRAQASAG